MKCTNCNLPLSPTRTTTHCPRCGMPLNAMQAPQQTFAQAGWNNGSSAPQQAYRGQDNGNAYPFPPMGQPGGDMRANPSSARPPYAPSRQSQGTPKLGFFIAGLCVILGAMLLIVVYVIALGSNSSSKNTAQATTPPSTSQARATTASSTTSPTPSPGVSPSATASNYPGQQYIYNAQMAMGVDQSTMQAQQPTTSFSVGSNMYVIFSLSPPATGGAVCSYWYLNGSSTPVTTYTFTVQPTLHASFTYAIYSSAGQAYVDLYWAADKSCTGQVLAQKVNFTVTD